MPCSHKNLSLDPWLPCKCWTDMVARDRDRGCPGMRLARLGQSENSGEGPAPVYKVGRNQGRHSSILGSHTHTCRHGTRMRTHAHTQICMHTRVEKKARSYFPRTQKMLQQLEASTLNLGRCSLCPDASCSLRQPGSPHRHTYVHPCCVAAHDNTI